jgi:hypothetical protein
MHSGINDKMAARWRMVFYRWAVSAAIIEENAALRRTDFERWGMGGAAARNAATAETY